MFSEEARPPVTELSLEAQSFRNLVNFYEDELRQIMSGEPYVDFFTVNIRRRLRVKGILGGGKGVRYTDVTPEAKKILGPVEGSLTPPKGGVLDDTPGTQKHRPFKTGSVGQTDRN